MGITFVTRRRAFAASSFCMALYVLGATSGVAQSRPAASEPPPAVARLFSVVRPAFSGDRALTTVAFVEQRWRWPGNRGFEESIDHIADQLRDAGYVDEKSAKVSAHAVTSTGNAANGTARTRTGGVSRSTAGNAGAGNGGQLSGGRDGIA